MPQSSASLSTKIDVRTRLRDDIIHGRLRPGEVVRDLELAARYGVSTSPVREALADLVSERLIEAKAHSVKRVTPLDRQRSLDFVAVFRTLALYGYTIGVEKIDQGAIEAMARTLASEESGKGGSFSLFADFHDPVFVASGNRELRRMLSLSLSWLQRLVILVIGRNRPREHTVRQAHETVDALKAGDAARAVSIFRQSLDDLQTEIEQLPEFL